MRKATFIVIILIESSDKMKKNGFTLTELLGVIIIMGILLTLTTFIVSGVIEHSNKTSAIASAKHLIKTITIDYTTNDNFTTDKLDILSFNFEGEKPKSGYIQFNESEKARFYMIYNEYCVVKDFDSEVDAFLLSDGDICNWETIDKVTE